MNILKKTKNFFKNEIVLSIAIVLTIVTCFFVPPDLEYFQYFEWSTLICLFCILTVVAGLKHTNVFEFISRKIAQLFKTRRMLIFSLVFGTFLLDMIVANDMSLITLLPLSYLSLHSTKNDKYIPITFIFQTIAANMGGMITPYGNPQNLYLYSFFQIPTLEFVKILIIQSVTVLVMLFIGCLFIKNESLKISKKPLKKVDKKKAVIYGILFITTILGIFRVIPLWIVVVLVVGLVLLIDRSRFKEVDYALLFTFVVFFIFSGNLARIPLLNNFLTQLVTGNTLLASIISCQFISNVPTAILLSKFTSNYKELLIGVNIGSLGILVSSLASLITLREFLKHYPKDFKKYIVRYTITNFTFLAVLLLVTYLIKI